MSERFCSLIVFAPGAPRTVKFHLSRGGLMLLLAAFVLSFLAVVLLGYKHPAEVNETHRLRLATENQALEVEAADAMALIQLLDAKVVELEETSKRIHELVEKPTS